jgi:predicted dehydrogenase
MQETSRRKFLKCTGLGVAASAASARRAASAGAANERIVVGVIGCGGRGTLLGKIFNGQPDSRVAYACDPDRSRAERAKAATGADRAVTDMRAILDDKAVDAVVIASCDHWHAPAAILAANAGKHVYVEKPCSHNLREGRLMIQAAREHNVVMQHGTQSRSSSDRQKAIQILREGAIGQVLLAKHVNSQKRANIGHVSPSEPPEQLDYDLWVGPAEWRPYQSNFVHYHWHWFFNFGTGDIGNDGVHGIDVARWGLGVQYHPSFVTGYGSKLFFDDDQEFPDTYQITFEYPGSGRVGDKRLLIYEQRIWSPYRQDADGNSIFFYGTEGMMAIGRSGVQVFGPNNKLISREALSGQDDAHQRDFLDAIKEGRRPNADIEIGHLSSSLCHLGNIVARVGRAIRFDPKSEQVIGDGEAGGLLRRKYREDHWAVPKSGTPGSPA